MARVAVTTEDLIRCSEAAVNLLRSGTYRDWTQKTGPIVLTRMRTACHIADCCLAYAGQIAVSQQEGYLPFRTLPSFRSTPDGMLDFVEGSARILAATAERFPEVVAWHPFGMTDTEGFVAMGCAEVLVHGWDLAFGMELDLQPDRAISSRLMARLAPSFATGDDSWVDLLTFCGRIPRNRPRPRRWRYDVTPRGT